MNFLSSVVTFFGDVLDTTRTVDKVNDDKVETQASLTIKTEAKPKISPKVKKEEKEDKTNIIKFNSRDDALDYYLKLLGEDEGCTLYSVGAGGHQASYDCEGCDDFRLRLSLKNRDSAKNCIELYMYIMYYVINYKSL